MSATKTKQILLFKISVIVTKKWTYDVILVIDRPIEKNEHSNNYCVINTNMGQKTNSRLIKNKVTNFH